MSESWIALNSAKGEDIWNKFLSRHPDSHIFLTLKWRDLLEQEYGFSPQYFYGLRDGECFAILPMFFIRNFTGTKLLSLPFSMYGGSLCVNPERDLKLTIEFAESLAIKLGCKKLRIWSTHQTTFPKIVCERGETDTILRLSSFERNAFIESLNYKVRYEIRKAEQHNFEIRVGKSSEELGGFYELFVDFRRSLGLPVPRYKFLEKVASNIDTNIISASLDGKVVSTSFVLHDRLASYNVYNATARGLRKANPGYLLYLKMMEVSAERGSQNLYLGGSPTAELLSFKKKWNPILRDTFLFTNAANRDARLKSEGISFLRILPKPMLEQVSYLLLRALY